MLFGVYDVLHLHWPDNILSSKSALSATLKMAALFLSVWWVRIRGRVVVWTAHNLDSHAQQHPRLERVYWRVFSKLLDGVFAPMASIARRVESDYRFRGVKRVAVTPFGDWSDFYSPIGVWDIRTELSIASHGDVVLWFGAVHPYKGVEALLEVFRDKWLANVTLVIAGQCRDKSYGKRLEALAESMSNVRLILEFVPDERVGDLVEGSDICIFPFREVTNTGSVRLALTFNRHVVVPDFPFAREFEQVLGQHWLTIYPRGGLEAQHILTALNTARAMRAQRVEWGSYNWDHAAAQTIDILTALVRFKG